VRERERDIERERERAHFPSFTLHGQAELIPLGLQGRRGSFIFAFTATFALVLLRHQFLVGLVLTTDSSFQTVHHRPFITDSLFQTLHARLLI
jgi:hypothetical protein